MSLNLLEVTERRAADAERQARREAEAERRAAEQANRAKSKFLSELSHELRTPLHAITGFSELIQTQDLSAERRGDALRHITDAAGHILALVEDVLDIARIEASALTIQVEDIDVFALVTEVIELLAPLAARHEVTLRTHEIAGAARADRRRLRQILLNVVTNAIQYNRAGGSVTLSTPPEATGCAIRVVDDGPGVSARLQSRVFVPFERLGDGQVEGADLGLALSRGLAEAMGGRLAFRSHRGTGTTVTISLPVGARPAQR